eukprot:jgi/Chrzof1/14235/Cz08g30170.t1
MAVKAWQCQSDDLEASPLRCQESVAQYSSYTQVYTNCKSTDHKLSWLGRLSVSVLPSMDNASFLGKYPSQTICSVPCSLPPVYENALCCAQIGLDRALLSAWSANHADICALSRSSYDPDRPAAKQNSVHVVGRRFGI